MNAASLRSAIVELGLSQTEFARLIEVTPRSVNVWVTDARAVPGPVAAYARLLLSLPKAMRGTELARLDAEKSDMFEGLYEFGFSGRDGNGIGCFVAMAGCVFGSDGGVKYDGVYEPSRTPGSSDVQFTLTVPPGVALVTGVPIQLAPYAFNLAVTVTNRSETTGRVDTPFGPVYVRIRFLRPLPTELAA